MRSYNIISNNSLNEYGTLCIVKNSLDISDIKFDTEGRVITFNIDSITVCNVYPKAGTDAESRKQREILFAQTIPNMLRFRKQKIIIGGDWNCIVEKKDCMNYPESKNSPSLKRLISLLSIKDSYRELHPQTLQFSHYYGEGSNEGATRIDRIYTSSAIKVYKATYLTISFSDHLCQMIDININEDLTNKKLPKPKLSFKIKPKIVDDVEFQSKIIENITKWNKLKEQNNYDLLDWLEIMVKPGIKKLAIEHTKLINKSNVKLTD